MTIHESGRDGTDAVTSDPRKQSNSESMTIVGIGASAGALHSLKQFFSELSAPTGVAFVVVVHLSPQHESHLAELLQPHCPIPVQQVTETIRIEPDRVYIIPPGANLESIDTHLRLSKLERDLGKRAQVDHFFRTLAETHDGHAIGVVLTGSGSDGTLGLRRIKECGGLTIVQSPDEAEYDGMPRSAITSGIVDLVLPIGDIPSEILRFASAAPRVVIPTDDEQLSADGARVLQKIFGQIRARTGHDFSQYKRSTIMRRIRRRMQLHQTDTLVAYLELLRGNHDEVVRLFDDLLITVTEFFRDREVYEHLEQEVIPRLFDGKAQNDRVRVWSVGCSTGEEAYSLAILLLEEAARRDVKPQLQVFASDLHSRSLDTARDGVYPEEIAADVSSARLKRFFTKEGSGYRVRREVRELVIFAPHNLLSDPPFSHLDLIVCRNLLIYLQRDVQQDIIGLFHYALEPDGRLVLGTSETIERSELFVSENKDHCVYRRQNVPSRHPRLPVFPFSIRHPDADSETDKTQRPDKSQRATSFGEIHERMVERYAPPSILINHHHDVVHYSSHAGRYLNIPGGVPTNNLFKLLREPLRIEMRAALHAVRDGARTFRTKPIEVSFDSDKRLVSIRATAVDDPELAGFFLIIFDELDEAPRPEVRSGAEDSTTTRELETELDLTRRRLQSVIEEYETGREEMQASNEELQSANEELRSTLEELETSKEELQSMNEELATVNQENRHRVEELAQLTADLQNLLAATDIATIFLDREMRIVRFTPKVGDLFNIRHSDRGRPLTDLTNRLGYSTLDADARRVLDRLTPIETEVEDESGQLFLVRLLPYRTPADHIGGVVITFIDITRRSRAESALRESEERYRLLVESATEYAIFMIDPNGVITSWNAGAKRIFQYDDDEIIGRNFAVLFTEEDRRLGGPDEEMQTATREGSASDERWHRRRDESIFWGSGVMTAVRGDGDPGFVKVLRDNTENKRHEKQMQMVMSELNHRVKNTLAVVKAVATQTLRNATDPAEFAETFYGRLQSIAKANELLTRSEWRGTDLTEILHAEFAKQLSNPERVDMSGPAVMLKPNAALAMHMIAHELLTNSLKYGSLSVSDGTLGIGWELDESTNPPRLRFRWQEAGGPKVQPPKQEGFGSKVLKQTVTYELDGSSTVEFDPAGLRCLIEFPIPAVEFDDA